MYKYGTKKFFDVGIGQCDLGTISVNLPSPTETSYYMKVIHITSTALNFLLTDWLIEG